MSDVHPYPQDITADPFVVFGGLLSRKVVTAALESIQPSNPRFLHEILELSRTCAKEEAFQKGIETVLNSNGFNCSKVKGKRYDRVIAKDFIIEVKLDNRRNDPQFWNGSQPNENALTQTRGYLDNATEFEWAIVTNGAVWRLMNKSSGFNYLDFWICDTDRSGETKQAAFLERILRDRTYLEELKTRSNQERIRFNNSFATGVGNFWKKFQKIGNRTWNVSLVEAVLCTAFARYLEDCGILPTLSHEYEEVAFKEALGGAEIVDNLRILRSQRFITPAATGDAVGILDEETILRISKLLADPNILEEFQKLFWDEEGAVDLSDLKVSFFGDAYQLFANKTDINGVDGQYFTGSELAKETAVYFVDEEAHGVAEDEVIYDPFVGSGQLLRALVPFFHLLIQGEIRDPSIVEGMRTLASRLRGTDVDPNACWLARLSLTISTAAKGRIFLDFSNKIKYADVFKTCFGFTESRWQSELGIEGKVRGIITNPPWRLLKQTTNELYTIETRNPAPLKANKSNWKLYQQWLKDGGKKRASEKSDTLKKLSKKHRETFARAGQGVVNVAISAADFVDRLPGVANKRWVIFLPDSFFVGKNKLRVQSSFQFKKYYSYPYNDHFAETDSVMKFGVLFGGAKRNHGQILCHPMGSKAVDVTKVFDRLKVLPIFGSEGEAVSQTIWLSHAPKNAPDWKNGEFNESSAPNKPNVQIAESGGTPVRYAKGCNDSDQHICVFRANSIKRWKNWTGKVKGSRVLVRDKRSNTRTGKVLWAGTHIPGENSIPKSCAITNSWNYLIATKERAKAYARLLNTPLADLAIRSVASKRNINKKDLKKLSLPALTDEQVKLLIKADNFCTWTAVAFVSVFRLSLPDARGILSSCGWVSETETKEILKVMQNSIHESAQNLSGQRVQRRRGQTAKAAKQVGLHSRRR